MRSLIWQLLQDHQDEVLPTVLSEYQHSRFSNALSTESDTFDLLCKLVRLVPGTRIVIDGLNELHAEQQASLLRALAPLSAPILIFSRPVGLFVDSLPGATILSIEARMEDIKLYVNARIQQDLDLRQVIGSNAGLLREVVSKVAGNAQGM